VLVEANTCGIFGLFVPCPAKKKKGNELQTTFMTRLVKSKLAEGDTNRIIGLFGLGLASKEIILLQRKRNTGSSVSYLLDST
jgi:hypothetical protein